MTFRVVPVILRQGEDGQVVAECPVLVGCVSQGRTREEAVRNIRKAAQLCLDSGDKLPDLYETVQVLVNDREEWRR